MFYRINWQAATRHVFIETGVNSAPAPISGSGMTNLGTFEHNNETERSTGPSGMQELADNHVIYHHVQDMLYKQGVQDMQNVKIYINTDTVVTPPGSAPTITTQPSITGNATTGSVLTLNMGAASGTPAPTSAIQWLRGTTAISGATGATYTLVSGDVGQSISARVTWTNSAGSVQATSNAITGQAPAPTATAPAKVTGLAYAAPRLTFTAPANGGSAITRYDVEIVAAAAAFTGTATGTSTTTELDVSAQPSGNWKAQVRAVNAVGNGLWSDPVSFNADLVSTLYGTGIGKIPLHLRADDAVIDGSGNVTSVPNRGGAGAAFDAAPVDGVMVKADGGLEIAAANLGLATDADMFGARLFIVAKRNTTNQAYFMGSENGGETRSFRLAHTAMPDGTTPASNVQFLGLNVGPVPRSIGTTVLHEIQILPTGMRVWQNGVEAQNAGVATLSGPVFLDVIGRHGNASITPKWTGIIYEIALVRTDGTAAADEAIIALRQSIASKYSLSFPAA